MGRQVSIDIITQLPNGDWALTLVEQGPWSDEDCNARLAALSERLWGCFEAITLGLLANKYPASLGAKVIIRLHCYGTRKPACTALFDRFACEAASEFKERLSHGADQFVNDIMFSYSQKSLSA